ncbi:uncharacterized protein LOC116805634 isoform X1 [Drosophila grimshawi]|uniref:uncharacterized protein LOC116805634 isoform X1 n=1 Tax=Drosophila grimshawi TaxID=7222 RepID=UPI001C9342F0|nr:uncharacterized protein LOC116805634 isoform X1 [Drosophila grimshawi]
MGFVYTQLVHAHAWKQFVYFSEESRQSSQFELNSTSGIPNYGNSRRHGSSYLRQKNEDSQIMWTQLGISDSRIWFPHQRRSPKCCQTEDRIDKTIIFEINCVAPLWDWM